MSEPHIAELARELKSSIELKMSAKGERYWDIKCYFEDGEDREVVERLRQIDNRLRFFFLDEPTLESQLEASVAQAQSRKAERAP